jgi:polysaccharide pyruvyl transferase WcaK-like protein
MTDVLLATWVGASIQLSRLEWMLGAGRPWKPGEKLKLLFAGYNGTRNTGSDVRVEEILRQVRRILGEKNVELSVMTQNFDHTRGYFGDARQVRLPDVFPPFLYREVRQNHGVVACEGSMFKSKFANALTVMIIGSLGMAAAQNKISVGWGAEAGHMDAFVARMCEKYCGESLIITRNPESQVVLGALGVPNELGTDTAWTFEPLAPEYGRRAIEEAGWDGATPVLALCPINPYWWPVKASMFKAAARKIAGAYKESHYRSLYFHRSGAAVDAAYERYLGAMARAVRRFQQAKRVFPIVVGMELLDRESCRRLAEQLGGAPVFTSDAHNMYEIVSILRAAQMIVSSRYHAVVTSMPAGVPSAGVTMDERLRNLMRERGHEHLLAEVDDAQLEEKLVAMMRTLSRDGEAIGAGLRSTVAKNIRLMARMGTYFEENVARRYPDFPLRSGALDWEEYLPSLSPGIRNLLGSQ